MKLINLKYYTRKTNFAKHRKHKIKGSSKLWHTAHILDSTWNISLRRPVIKAKQTGSKDNKRKYNELELGNETNGLLLNEESARVSDAMLLM